jgi:signal transduction histidine kinase/DNA-binding response OmpR family regulator/CHASE3 domain sensor protein
MIKARLFIKVLGYFALLLLVLTAVTVLTLSVLNQIEKHFTDASSNSEQLIVLEQLNKYIAEMPSVTEQYLFTGNDSVRVIYDNGWKEFDGLVMNIRSQVQDTNITGSLEIVRIAYYQWIAEIGEKKMLLREKFAQGKNIQSQLDSLIILDTKTGYLTTAREHLHYLITDILTSQPATILLAKNLARNLGSFIIIVNLLFALFAIVLGFVLTRSITNPIKLLKDGTQGIMSGDFTPLELNRNDELGDLASDFNKMSVMLGNNYTRLKAYSELVTALNTRASMTEIEANTLNLLCYHVNAAVGALYLADDDDKELMLVAGHALKSSTIAKKFRIGEGLPGQCAVEKKAIEISDVRVGMDFVMDTGIAVIIPQQIIASPIFYSDRVLGVLVVGSLYRFSDLDKEIIVNSLPQLGIAIANAKNYEETQKLSREILTKNTELNTKNEELEKAYRVKSEFLASMSHELRTPLNSIIGFSSVLLSPSGDPLTDDQRKALEKVLKNGKHLLQLINDILDFSKLESGRMSVNVEVDEVGNVVANSLMTVESLAKSKNLTIVQNIPEGLPVLQTDILKIKQVLVNLLSNAVKFTEQGDITVTVGQRNNYATFAVKDSGIGIEQKDYGKIFEEFQQIDNSNTRKYKGTGLGLPISRRLARLLGGDLVVESDYGRGSTFILMVPFIFKENEPVHPQDAARVPDRIIPERIPAKRTESITLKEVAPIETKKTSFGRGPLVLCIDDDPEVIELLKNYLVPEGFSVAEANSGDEGISKAAEISPAIITLDIMMPNKDGWQTLRELKQDPKTRSIPVVIHSIIENRPLAFSLGAVGVLTKPTDSGELLSILKREVNSKEHYVLLVDDNEDFLMALERIVTIEGYNVRTATSGMKALEILQHSVPSLIFTDLVMPEMDGFQLVQRLQNNDRWRNIPIVVLSGKDLSDREKEILNTRISDYLKKSEFSPESLTSALKRILNKK